MFSWQSVASPAMWHWGTCPPPSTSNSFIFSSLWSKIGDRYCVVCESSGYRWQHHTAVVSISTALVTKLFVIEQLLHPALKSAMSSQSSIPNFQLCLSSQQMLATPLMAVIWLGDEGQRWLAWCWRHWPLERTSRQWTSDESPGQFDSMSAASDTTW